MQSRFCLALVLSLSVSLPAAAQSKVLVGPFKGPKAQAAAARKQVQKALCDNVECVTPSQVTTAGQPDWKKMKKAGASAVVLGSVSKVGKKYSVELRVMTKAKGGPAWKNSFAAAPNGRMLAPVLKKAVAGIQKGISSGGGSSNEEESEPVAAVDEGSTETPAGETAEAPEAAEAAPSRIEEVAPTESTKTAQSEEVIPSRYRTRTEPGDNEASDSDTADEPDTSSGPSPFALVTVQAGLDFYNRSYAMKELSTGNLRDYKAPLIFTPRVRVESHPLVKQGGAVGGLGAELDFAMAMGLKSGPEGGPTFPTSMSRMDLGVLYSWRPMTNSGLTVEPHLGYRRHSFGVGEGDGGAKLDGLPGIAYGGFRLGAGVEVPFMKDQMVGFGQLAFMPSLSTGEIGKSPFFSSGKASGLEVSGGVGYRMGKMELRGTVQFTQYSLSFEAADGGEFVASGASDRYLGGSLGARYSF